MSSRIQKKYPVKLRCHTLLGKAATASVLGTPAFTRLERDQSSCYVEVFCASKQQARSLKRAYDAAKLANGDNEDDKFRARRRKSKIRFQNQQSPVDPIDEESDPDDLEADSLVA